MLSTCSGLVSQYCAAPLSPVPARTLRARLRRGCAGCCNPHRSPPVLSQTTALIRVAFLGLMLAINGAKLGFMVRGMAALGATVFVAIDLVAGTITEAIADAALFGHRPSLRWTTGAALMTAGVFVVAMEQARAQRAADARAAAVAGASAEAAAVAGAEAAGPAGAAPVAGEYDAPGTPHSVPAAASDSDGDDVGTSANRRSSSGPSTRRRARRAD